MFDFTTERGSTRTAPTAAGPDPLASAREAFYGAPAREGQPGEPPHRPGDDGSWVLLDAEYGPRPLRLAAHGAAPRPSREDAVVASLRRACRLDVTLTPEALLAHAHRHPMLASVLREMWPDTVRRHGTADAEEVLRHLLYAAPDASRTAFLLDCAASTGLRPLPAAEAARRVASPDRRVRHAVWRYLHLLPDGASHLPAPDAAEDPYERLLLAPPVPDPQDVRAGPGVTVAQTMLQGDLDTPGQGASGGMAVLLGALGDELAARDGIGRVLTVVTAGRDSLARDARLLRRRGPGHWVLRLPLDAPTAPRPDEWPDHRPALAWWAERLFASPFRPDIVHVRYADDAALALAHAASRVRARLLFTATPDPHRTLVRKYAEAAAGDAHAENALRDDLHRVFCADRLVARADTVVAIPGRTGTRDLLRYFPVLRTRYGVEGPPAPPEGIAPYAPVRQEEDLRRRLLGGLFADGSRVDALCPEDRSLPLLLCVGRLHPVKQQDLLVRTWLTAELWRTTTLVVIGGTPGDSAAPHERQMRAAIDRVLRDRDSVAARRLALVPAMPNSTVRRLEHALADPVAGAPAWYVCPSAKEEFGIAVLEAMEAGLPAAGPRRGGVPHYLRDGVNGILLDTSTAAGLAAGLHRIAAFPEERRRFLGTAARETVASRYAITDMARALADTYLATDPSPARQ